MPQYEIEDYQWILSPLRKELLFLIHDHPLIIREELLRLNTNPQTTIVDNITFLIEHAIVKKIKKHTNQTGRPPIMYRLTEYGQQIHKHLQELKQTK